jgi:glycosyltransferase involved in cell wall biosynthesis
MKMKQGEIILSFIIPVYNGSKTIIKTLDSILQNNIVHPFEIIIVNDGSTDNTLEVLETYSQKDLIKIYTQKNQGVSIARNKGIEICNGKYILFIDADDWIDSNNINEIISNFLISDSDVFQFSAAYFANEKNITLKKIPTHSGVAVKHLRKFHFSRGEVWNYVFKKEIINLYHLRFLEGVRLSEDQNFVYKYLSVCNRFSSTEKITYYYYTNNLDSAVKKIKTHDDIMQHLYVLSDLIAFYKQVPECNKSFYLERIYMLISYTFFYLYKNMYLNNIEKRIFKSTYKKIIQQLTFQVNRNFLVIYLSYMNFELGMKVYFWINNIKVLFKNQIKHKSSLKLIIK